MERYQRLALLVTKIYGATFLALSFGWGIAGLVMLFLGPQWQRSGEGYLATSGADFLAGAGIIGFSGLIAKFAVTP